MKNSKLVKFLPFLLCLVCSSCGCEVEELLKDAEQKASYAQIDSLNAAWNIYLQAQEISKNQLSTEVPKTIEQRCDSLFDEYLKVGNLDSAAICVDLGDVIRDNFGWEETPYVDAGEIILSPEGTGDVSRGGIVRSRSMALADAYKKQGDTANDMCEKYPSDEVNQKIKNDSYKQAHKYNPEKYPEP